MARPFQRLEEITGPLVVGRTYLVPHVFQHALGSVRGYWVPVRGTIHADEELSVNYKHIHFDERFMSKPFMRKIGIDEAATYIVRIGPETYSCWSDGKVQHFPARCLNNKVGFAERGHSAPFMAFHSLYRDKSLINGHICPHRGFDLTTIPANEQGVKLCPLHGLHWCAKTGRNVNRYTMKPAESLATP